MLHKVVRLEGHEATDEVLEHRLGLALLTAWAPADSGRRLAVTRVLLELAPLFRVEDLHLVEANEVDAEGLQFIAVVCMGNQKDREHVRYCDKLLDVVGADVGQATYHKVISVDH